jgi:uncharacterized membrane protein YdbT with pleckstrin-like domain
VAFPRKLLNEGEEIVLDLRPHWWFMAEPTAALVGAIVLGVIVLTQAGDKGVGNVLKVAAAALVVFCIGWFLVRYARWVTTNFVVTSDRVVFRRGVLAKAGVEIPLDKVNTVFFNQSIFERMLGAGDLRIESAGEGGSENFSDIRKPSIVQNEIYKQMEANENRKFDRARPEPAPAPAPVTQPASGALSIPEQIERLDELRRRGVISDEEFGQKKTELLDRM